MNVMARRHPRAGRVPSRCASRPCRLGRGMSTVRRQVKPTRLRRPTHATLPVTAARPGRHWPDRRTCQTQQVLVNGARPSAATAATRSPPRSRARATTFFRPPADEVDQDVLAEPLGRRVEGAAAVHAGHQRHEVGQGARPLEHERVDGDALLRAALHLAEGLLDRAPRRRVVELDLAVLEVGGRLAVGDDDDLLVDRRVALEDVAGQGTARAGGWCRIRSRARSARPARPAGSRARSRRSR